MALYNIFLGDKKLSDILNEIYVNQNKKSTQISGLSSELKPLIENIGDATLIVPMIKEYMEIGVKNDEHLIKLVTVIQRIETAQAKGESGEFDFSDLQSLLEKQEQLEQGIQGKQEDEGV